MLRTAITPAYVNRAPVGSPDVLETAEKQPIILVFDIEVWRELAAAIAAVFRPIDMSSRDEFIHQT